MGSGLSTPPSPTPPQPHTSSPKLDLDYYVWQVPKPGAGWQVVSCMHALRRDARGVTFRNLRTGRPRKGGPTPSWLGTVGYLILAEQIGKAVIGLDAPINDPPGIARAVTHFGPHPLTPDEVDVLRSLRNAFAHDYGLVSYGVDHTKKKNAPSGRYRFVLLPRSTPMIRPGAPWNLDWQASSLADATQVGVMDARTMSKRWSTG